MQQACLWNKTSVWECVCESGIAKHLYVLPFLSNTSRAPALEAVHSKSQAGFALVASGLCRAPLHEKALKGARGSCFPEHGEPCARALGLAAFLPLPLSDSDNRSGGTELAG